MNAIIVYYQQIFHLYPDKIIFIYDSYLTRRGKLVLGWLLGVWKPKHLRNILGCEPMSGMFKLVVKSQQPQNHSAALLKTLTLRRGTAF